MVILDSLEVSRKSQALVLTPEDPHPELMRLSYALEQAMLAYGQDQARREFRPHLTLARDFQAPVPEANSPPEFFLRADRFSLYESHKEQYRIIAEWPLVHLLKVDQNGVGRDAFDEVLTEPKGNL